MAVQIECMGEVLADRARRRHGGAPGEQQTDDPAVRTGERTLMRYLLRRGLGPLMMTPLPVGAPEALRTRPGGPAGRPAAIPDEHPRDIAARSTPGPGRTPSM